MPKRIDVHGVRISVLTWDDALNTVVGWASRSESRAVYASNVHSVITARTDSEHRNALESADMVTPDGAPIAYLMRSFGRNSQERIDGPTLMWEICKRVAPL